jgi:hypothetical protein
VLASPALVDIDFAPDGSVCPHVIIPAQRRAPPRAVCALDHGPTFIPIPRSGWSCPPSVRPPTPRPIAAASPNAHCSTARYALIWRRDLISGEANRRAARCPAMLRGNDCPQSAWSQNGRSPWCRTVSGSHERVGKRNHRVAGCRPAAPDRPHCIGKCRDLFRPPTHGADLRRQREVEALSTVPTSAPLRSGED